MTPVVHQPARRALLTLSETASRLGCSELTVRRMVADGRLVGVRLGATSRHPLRVDKESLERLLGGGEAA